MGLASLGRRGWDFGDAVEVVVTQPDPAEVRRRARELRELLERGGRLPPTTEPARRALAAGVPVQRVVAVDPQTVAPRFLPTGKP